jgi:RimJ/RimL family protein N-acetyltransferase
VLPRFAKHGFATEAVGALIDWAFEDERTRAIVADADDSVAARRVLEKNGLRREPGGETGLIRYALRRPPPLVD